MRWGALAWLALLVCACACAREPQLAPVVDHTGPAPVEGPRTLVLVPVGAEPALPAGSEDAPVLHVEVAARLEQRRRGLSGRDALAADHGMLFFYAVARPRLFWMKDCRIALDVAFLDDDGTILRVATLPPGAGKAPSEVESVRSDVAVRFVLEAAGGWLREHDVGVGDHVDVSRAVRDVVPD